MRDRDYGSPHGKEVSNMRDHSELLIGFADWMRSWNAADRTIEARVQLASRWLETYGLDGLTGETVSAFLSNRDLSSFTRVTYYNHLACLIEYLQRAGLLGPEEDPLSDVRKPRAIKAEPRPLSEADVDRIMSTATGVVRDWIDVALMTGLRVSEIAKLRGEDVSPEGIWVAGKGDKRVNIPCHPDIWEMAQRYPRRGYWWPGSDDGHVPRVTISVTVGRLFRSLGIDGSIHRCRHSYVTRLLRAGVHVRRVQKLARHASLETTAGYAAVDEIELREAILLLPSNKPPPDAA